MSRGQRDMAETCRVLAFPSLIVYGAYASPEFGVAEVSCVWRAIIGFSCPGCGLSRAAALLVRGDIRAAMSQNWLILPIAVVLMAQSLRALVIVFTGRTHG